MSESNDLVMGQIAANHSIRKGRMKGLVNHVPRSSNKRGFTLVHEFTQQHLFLCAVSECVKDTYDGVCSLCGTPVNQLNSPDPDPIIAAILFQYTRRAMGKSNW